MRLLGLPHFVILAAISLFAWAFTALARYKPQWKRGIAASLGVALAINELVWYAWRLHTEGFRFPDGLPLELCDLTLWLTVILTFAPRPAMFDFTWLAGMGGSAMAVLTPDLWAAPFSYPTIYFFVAHGGVIAILLYLVWSGLARPRPGCVWRGMLWLNVYVAFVGTFDAVFHTNYMYLCVKPASTSLLSYLGPWPIYLLGGEAAAVVLFWLLWMPFKAKRQLLPN